MPFAPELRTHSQKVCTLYKKAMRTLEAYYVARNVVRYHQVILRSEFDKHKCVTNAKEQRRLLWVGEHELFKKITPLVPCKFPRSYGEAGGVACERVVTPPDWVLDYWHPLEKAHFPDYFKRREARKCEYIQKWHKAFCCSVCADCWRIHCVQNIVHNLLPPLVAPSAAALMVVLNGKSVAMTFS